MKIFLSHSRAQSAIAERLALSLRGEGFTVFFDQSDIGAGEEYDSRIRKAIDACELFVFMISPESVAPDSYPLAELGIAEERWAHPKGHVLPLVVQPVDIDRVPSYLRAVSIFDPQGDFVAESSAAIARIAATKRRLVLRVPLAIVVILVLAALTGWFGYRRFKLNREARDQISRALSAANSDLEAREYSDAFAAVTAAVSQFPAEVALRKMQERVAMVWLRNISVRVGEQTFSGVVAKLRPVLISGVSAATGEAAGDLLAHLGWCEYLRARDGNADGDPVSYFKKAIDSDRSNPYAHSMWGFWIMFNRGTAAEAQPQFELADAAGRDRSWVRNLQLSAFLLNYIPANEREAIRSANTMRQEQLAVQEPNRLWSIYEQALLRGVDTAEFLLLLPPAEHLMTFEWLFPHASVSESKLPMYLFLSGRLEEAAGNRDSALSSYRQVEAYFRANQGAGPLLDRAREGLARLAKENR